MSIRAEHASTAPETEQGEPPRPGRRWRFALVGLVGIYAVLAVYGLIVNSGELGGPAASSAAASRTAAGAPSAAISARPVTFPAMSTAGSPAPYPLGVASIMAFGPEGTADGDNPGLAPGILDVGTDQPWYSQWYATPESGDLRSGTGLLLDLGETVTVRDLRLVLGSAPGTDVQVRAGNSPSVDLPTVASASGASGTVRLTMTIPATARYVLIWFTRLPPDGLGHYQVRVYNVFVDG